ISAKEEVGESLALVVDNESSSTINQTGLQLGLVSEYEYGEGLPYAPMGWPNVRDKWGWRTVRRATNLGTFKDSYLYLPEHFQALKDGKKNAFRSKTSVKKYLQSKYLGMDIDQFFSSFSWMIPSNQSQAQKV
ncbi:hypothetical protein EJD97_015419, partial [Solanum chilense]